MRIDVPRLSRTELLGRLSSLATDQEIAPLGREALRKAVHASLDDEALSWVLRCAYDVLAGFRSSVELSRIVEDTIATPTEAAE